MLTSTVPVRLLGESDRLDMSRLLGASPIAAAPLVERITTYGISAWRAGGRFFGHGVRGQLAGVCWRGSNVMPMGESGRFAEMLATDREGVGSIAGPADAVLDLWENLEPVWGKPRTIRACQPLLVAYDKPTISPDPKVQQVRRQGLEAFHAAAVAMYTEELGVPPVAEEFRRRVVSLVRARRAYARIEDGEVLFKAELAVVTSHTVQIQGVWVPPKYRGQGLGAAGLATVVADGLRRLAPTVSLYVNDYNVAARRVYDKCGFTRTDTFSTILL